MQRPNCYLNHQGNLSGPKTVFLVVTSTKITSCSENEHNVVIYIKNLIVQQDFCKCFYWKLKHKQSAY